MTKAISMPIINFFRFSPRQLFQIRSHHEREAAKESILKLNFTCYLSRRLVIIMMDRLLIVLPLCELPLITR